MRGLTQRLYLECKHLQVDDGVQWCFAGLERRGECPREIWCLESPFEMEEKCPPCLTGVSPPIPAGEKGIHDIEHKLKAQVLDDGTGPREDNK